MELNLEEMLLKSKIVGIDEVRPNSWNPKDKNTAEFKTIKRGIELKGQRLPIVVRENNGYEIIDGEQRWTSCKELGKDKIWIINEGKISDKEAQELTIWYQQQVQFNEVDLASLVTKIVKENQDYELPFDEIKIQEFQGMAEFDWNNYNTKGEDNSEEGFKTLSIKLTQSQYDVIISALDKVKEEANCKEGRALELICANYISGE